MEDIISKIEKIFDEFDSEYNFDEEDIQESFSMNENIPADLLKAYSNSEKASKGGYGDQSINSVHGELNKFKNNRKHVFEWDYGKSNYEKLTVEQAIDYLNLQHGKVSEIASKLPNIRLIINGKLAEWENHNGKIYYLYYTEIPWQKLRDIDYPGFKGKGSFVNDTKFAQTAKDILACLKCADVIYKTDEYDHPISQEEKDKKILKKYDSSRTIGKLSYLDLHKPGVTVPDGYDQFTPLQNYLMSKTTTSKYDLDTGAHSVRDRFRWMTELNQAEYEKYLNAYDKKKKLKQKLLDIRGTYKKLLREKDDFDEEEFNELKEKWEAKLKEAEAEYNKAAKEFRNEAQKYNFKIDEETEKFHEKLYELLNKWEDLISSAYEQTEYLNTETSSTSYFLKDDASAWREKGVIRVIRDIKDLIHYLEEDKTRLQEIISNNTDLESVNSSDVDSLAYAIETKEQLLNDKLLEYEELQKGRLTDHLTKLKRYNVRLKELQDELDKIRPKSAAKTQEKAKKAGTATLDPSISSIINFKNFSSDVISPENTEQNNTN